MQMRLGLSMVVAALLSTMTARAQSWQHDQSVTQTSPLAGGVLLGSSVAIGRANSSGASIGQRNVMLVGAPNATVSGQSEAGAVLVYKKIADTWALHDTLTSNSVQAGAHFGASIATGQLGFYAIGAPDWDSNSITDAGRVEFFRTTGVDSDAFLRNGQLAGGGSRFGNALAIDGEFLAIGSSGSPGLSSCAWAFRASLSSPFNWTFIDNACRPAADALGASVAIRQTSTDNFILVAGAPGYANAGFAASGAAFGYTMSGGALVEFAQFSPPNPAIIDVGATSVAINAVETVFVGATGRDLVGVGRTGSVSVFKELGMPGYQFIQELFPSAPRLAGDLCGASLAVDDDNDRFVLGCPGSDGTTANEGAARLFQQSSLNVWAQTRLTYQNQLHGSDDLGRAVALVGARVFVGAPRHDVAPDSNHGAVEIFTNDPVFSNGFESPTP